MSSEPSSPLEAAPRNDPKPSTWRKENERNLSRMQKRNGGIHITSASTNFHHQKPNAVNDDIYFPETEKFTQVPQISYAKLR